MNFCVAILILKMEENTQHFWHIVLYCFKKGSNEAEIQKGSGVCRARRRCCDERTCQKWCVRFRAGGSSLDDAPRSGRPAEITGNQIGALLENDQHFTMETANIFKISKSVRLLVKMKKYVFCFMEKNPTDFLASPILYVKCPALGVK